MIDPSFFEDFVQETSEHLDEMETALLELESKKGDSDLLNDVFRTVHTIKGSAEYLGVERIAELSHKLENLLELLRQGEMGITPAIFETLMNAKDIMSSLINDLESHREEKTAIENILERIEIQTNPATRAAKEPFSEETTDAAISPGITSDENKAPVGPSEDGLEVTLEKALDDALGGNLSEELASNRPANEKQTDSDTGYHERNIFIDESLADDPIQKDIEGESDTELFEIFLKQHKENIDLIQLQIPEITDSETPSEPLAKCLKYIDNLKSSANYMGYDNVLRLYDKWELELKETLKQLLSGHTLNIQNVVDNQIKRYIDTIKKHLPQLDQEEPAEKQDQTESNYDFLTDMVAEINEVDESLQPLKPPDTDEESDAEIIVEDTDEELFAIFLQQLDENISAINVETQSLPYTDNLSATLDACLENIQKLRASANYMGFDKAVAVYESWHVALMDYAAEAAMMATDDSFRTAIAEINRKNLNHIVKLFPRVQEFLTQEMIDKPVVETETPITLEKETTPTKAPAEVPAVIDLADEIYEEEMDEELFEIFLQQLQENLEKIKTSAESLPTSDQPEDALTQIMEGINNLQSSANYMGYDQLTLYLQNWHESIAYTRNECLTNQPAAWPQFLEARISSRIRAIMAKFPKIEDTFDLKARPDVRISDKTIHATEAEETIEELTDPVVSAPPIVETDDAALFNKLGNAFEAEPEVFHDVTTEPTEDDQQLFNNLMRGFDVTPEVDPSTQIYEGLFGEEAHVTEPKPQAIPKPPLKVESPAVPEVPASDHRPLEKKVTEAPVNVSKKAVTKPVAPKKETPETKVDQLKDKIIKQSLRVDAKKIDSLLNQVGELVVNRAYFSQLFNEMRDLQQYLKDTIKLDQREMKMVRGLTFKLNEATVSLGRIANELQEGVMKVRMLPISQLFNRYPRLVRDLAKDTGKKVKLEVRGEDTELDKMIIEELSDPLLHIIRNAVDHGLESIEERKACNKPEQGRLRFEAYHESNHVVIEISDDGRGINLEKIKRKALEKKIVTPEELSLLTDKEITALIMRPGFSTADKITTTSGRGVGMDVVKKNIENLSGTLEIESIEGVESRFRIKIPLTLAIIQALLIQVNEDTFTIPLAAVEETLRIFENETTTIEGVEVIQLRDSTLPLVRLREVFNINTTPFDTDKVFVVVVSTGMRRIGLVVDRLIRQEEVVIKPLVDYLQENSGFSGATILGDGSISLILDVYELVNLSIGKQTQKRKALIY